jgi:hypothetical protein
VHAACHSDPITKDGEYCLTVDEVRNLLATRASEAAPLTVPDGYVRLHSALELRRDEALRAAITLLDGDRDHDNASFLRNMLLDKKDAPVAPTCETCGGRGEVGGFVHPDGGYQTDPCPDCGEAAPVAVGDAIHLGRIETSEGIEAWVEIDEKDREPWCDTVRTVYVASQAAPGTAGEAKDATDTLVAVLNAIGYTEEFAAAHPDLKVSEGVKLFLASQAAPTTTLTDGLRDQLETLGAHDTGGRFCVYMSRADARAILAAQPASSQVKLDSCAASATAAHAGATPADSLYRENVVALIKRMRCYCDSLAPPMARGLMEDAIRVLRAATPTPDAAKGEQ